ncbi:MAG: hypothetical protein ABUL60_21805 [Myxococcales bacterium]
MTSPKSPSPASEAPAAPAATSGPDVALVHRVTPDGTVHVIRRRGDQLEAGALQPLREGAPIQGEVLSLRPRENFPLLCDVDVLYSPPAAAKPAAAPAPRPARRKGPAQVATDEYRDNWDSIWSRKKTDALN